MRNALKVILAISIICAALLGVSDAAEKPSAFELDNTAVAIFDPATSQLIGKGHYNVKKVDGGELIEGENIYLNGERDLERSRIARGRDGAEPTLISYQHRFFNADGSPQFSNSLDQSGAASCKRYGSGAPDIREANLEVPPDTYAGATQLMVMVGLLRLGASSITFHIFNCIPGPRIIAVKGTLASERVKWPLYPGDLQKVEIVPDLGWLNLIVAPFLPKVSAWFDPNDDWNYVGGQFDRFYKGRHIVMVRAAPDKAAAIEQGATAPVIP